jgi:hypothetical protein
MRMRIAALVVGLLGVVTIGTAHAGFENVPEPGSIALLATGVAGLAGAGWWFRRRK